MLLEFHGIFLYPFNLVKVKVRGCAYLVHPWNVKLLKYVCFGTALDTIPVPGLLDHPIWFPWHIFKLGEAPLLLPAAGERVQAEYVPIWSTSSAAQIQTTFFGQKLLFQLSIEVRHSNEVKYSNHWANRATRTLCSSRDLKHALPQTRLDLYVV